MVLYNDDDLYPLLEQIHTLEILIFYYNIRSNKQQLCCLFVFYMDHGLYVFYFFLQI